MSDRLKLSDPKSDAEVERVALTHELIADHQKIRALEQNIATLEKELAKRERSVPPSAAPPKNKIGARKQGSFMAISTAPSINKTPIGPSMVPVPYPTVQDLTNSTETAKTVNFNGFPAYLLDCSKQSTCKGDAPGTGKGVRSGTVSGEVKPIQGSRTVRIEGKRVVREGDTCTMNGGNNPGVYVTKCAARSIPSQTSLSDFNRSEGHRPEGPSQTNASEIDFHQLFGFPELTPAQKLSALMQKDILDGTAFSRKFNKSVMTGSGPFLVPAADKSGPNPHVRTQNSLTIALLGGFGGPGAAARLAGMSEERVAAANEIGAAGMGLTWALSGFPQRSGMSPAARSAVKVNGEGRSTSVATATGGSNDGIKVIKTAAKDAYHATSSSKLAESVLKGIDKKYLNAESRFGKAFHVAEDPQTALAEMIHHQVDPTTGIRFTMNRAAMKVLDLTDPKIAALYGYKGGPISNATKAIGEAAIKDGYNVIRYGSERNPGGINNAVISDFNDILKPQIVTPIK